VDTNTIRFWRSLRGRLLLYLVLPMVVISSAVITFRAINSFAVVGKQAQRQLCNLAEQVAIEQSPSTVVITDVSGNIEYAKPKFMELAGSNNAR